MDTSTPTPGFESNPSPAAARPTVSRLRLFAAGAAFAGVAATAGIGLAIAGGGTTETTVQQAAPAASAAPGTQADPNTQTTPAYPQGWDTTAQAPGGHDGGRDHHGTPPGGFTAQGGTGSSGSSGGLTVPNTAGGPGHASTGGS